MCSASVARKRFVVPSQNGRTLANSVFVHICTPAVYYALLVFIIFYPFRWSDAILDTNILALYVIKQDHAAPGHVMSSYPH